MSEKNINRWRDAIIPKHDHAKEPWTLHSGGSWDMTQIKPIPDDMLVELMQMYHCGGTPWNCRSFPVSPHDREWMYLLYYSMQGLVARMRLAERDASRHAARAELLSEALVARATADTAKRTVVQVYLPMDGDDPFIWAVHGKMTTASMSEIEALWLEDGEAYFGRGPGLYLFEAYLEEAEYEGGHLTYAGGITLDEVGFVAEETPEPDHG